MKLYIEKMYGVVIKIFLTVLIQFDNYVQIYNRQNKNALIIPYQQGTKTTVHFSLYHETLI